MTETTQYPNWFAAYADRFFDRHLHQLAGLPGLRFLQIGAFTGDASVWLLDNILTGEGSVLVDVDTWEGSDEAIHGSFDWQDVERTYRARTAAARAAGRLEQFIGSSEDYFEDYGLPGVGETVILKKIPFDFIYIDGDHTACGVLNDAVNAYRVLKLGGLLAFDDYLWQSGKGDPHDPRLAIDAFASVHRDRLVLLEIGSQAWFRKIA